MATQLPFFKFNPSAWINGNISLENDAIKGLFISICAYYWERDCKLTYTQLRRRFRHSKKANLKILFESKLIKKNPKHDVFISFLDYQLRELETKKEQKRLSGTIGAKKRWHTHGSAMADP